MSKKTTSMKEDLIKSIKDSLNALVEPLNAHMRNDPKPALYSAGSAIDMGGQDVLVTVVFTFGEEKSAQLIDRLSDIAGHGATVGLYDEDGLRFMDVKGPDDVQ